MHHDWHHQYQQTMNMCRTKHGKRERQKERTEAAIRAERKNWSSGMSNILNNDVGIKYIVNAGNCVCSALRSVLKKEGLGVG